MAKSVEIAKARRKKQAMAQAQKEREMWNKVRKPLMIAVAAVVILGLGWYLYSNFIYLPANGVRVSNGTITGTESNWIVSNFGTTSMPDCRRMASYTAPAGYTLDTTELLSTNSSKLTQTRLYRAEDPTALIQQVYVAGVTGKTPEAMVDTLLGNGFFTESERVEAAEVAGMKVACLYSKTQSINENGQAVEGMGSASLYIYTPAMNDSSCVVVLTTGEGKLDELPTAAEILADAEAYLAGLKVTK